MRVTAAVAVLALLAAPAAWADAPIPTANPTQTSVPQPEAPPPPLPPGHAAGAAGPEMAMGPCGPEKVRPDGHLATTPHGEVDAGVGTNGYRHIGGTLCQPIGDNAAVQVSVSDTQSNGWRGGRR